MKFVETTKENQQNDEKLGQNENQRFGTGLSQTSQRISFECCRRRQFRLDC